MFSEASVSHSVHRGSASGGLHPGRSASGGVCIELGLPTGSLH